MRDTFKEAVDEVAGLGLPPVDKALVQTVLIVQDLLRSEWHARPNAPFEEWTVGEICRAMKIQVPQ